MEDLTKPLLFLWEICSYADELKLGYIDDKPFEPGIWKQNELESKWMAWTRYDRLGAMPNDVAPERFYLWSPLRSRGGVGDFSGTSERIVKIATKRFVDAMMDMGQENVRVFPLTFWRRSEGSTAPTPEPDEPLRAVHCWAKTDVFDMAQSEVQRLNPRHYRRHTGSLYDNGDPEPPIYVGSLLRLSLCEGVHTDDIRFPPLFGIRGLVGRLFVSPQFAKVLQSNKLKVNLIKRDIDYLREVAIGEAIQAGRLTAWPERQPLGL